MFRDGHFEAGNAVITEPGVTFSVREMAPVRSCVEELAAGKEAGILRDTAWGKDITVPRGVMGKADSGKHGYGVDHIMHKRILHGLTEDEAAFVAVCAMKAAQSVKAVQGGSNKMWFDRFGVRAVVAEDAESGTPMITGFIWHTKDSNKAVDSDAAHNSQHFYALDELSRVHQVGAAMQRAVARFENIIKENPRDWEQIVSHVVEKLKVKQNAKADGTFMKAPNGAETNLTEDQWLSVRTKAFKRWFGDWENDPENASKVVDENGEPKVVYHGTEKDFEDVFQDVHTWEDFEDDDHGLIAPNTFWFADKKFTAQTYQASFFATEGKQKK